MANDKAFKIKNGLSAKRYLQNSTAVSASDVDLFTGSYFTKTLSANTTFTFSNPPASGKATGFALEVTGADVTTTYDLANGAYDSKTGTAAGQISLNESVYFDFKADGTKLYILRDSGTTIYQYSLSTAWDISTMSYDSVTKALSSVNTPTELVFKPDGTSFYVPTSFGDRVQQWNLSTAWDLSTTDSSSDAYMSTASQGLTPATNLAFKSDGTKMYVGNSTTVYQYSLSTAWDVSTASYDSVSQAITIGSGTGWQFKPDGTALYVMDRSSPYDNCEFTMSTPWDITTLTQSSNTFVISYVNGGQHMRIGNSGNKLYALFRTDMKIYQYSISGSSADTVAWPSSVKWSGATAPDAPASGEKDVYVFVTTDGGTTYYGKQAAQGVA